MRAIYHDLTEEQWNKLNLPVDPDDYIVSDNGTIHPCISCFNCWLKTPGRCTLKDGYERSGENIACGGCVNGVHLVPLNEMVILSVINESASFAKLENNVFYFNH